MCGVVGAVGLALPKADRIAAVRDGLRAILHRGPEEVGFYDDDTATLGAVRLSIVDLLRGKQPMTTDDGRYVVGFNGEIFNFIELREELRALGVIFHTRSDTEVLLNSLAHWGVEAALPKLNGQFGFAFYDRVTRQLVLGRDPFGERPMYYAARSGTCFFASEVKGLFAFPQVRRALNPSALAAAARYWSPIPDETCFEGVRCLPQGHYARIGPDGAIAVHKYYEGFETGRGSAPTFRGSFADGLDELRERLRASIKLRLRGDYAIGASISGGLDSSIIATVMKELEPEGLRTFSIRVADRRLDEGPQQELLAQALGAEHSSVLVTPRDIRERFPGVVEQCEMPLHRAAPVACNMIAEHIGQSGVRIVLGGEGADEQFLGYDITKEALIAGAPGADRTPGATLARLREGLFDTRQTRPSDVEDILRFHGQRREGLGALFTPHMRRFESEPLEWLQGSDGAISAADDRLLAWVLSQAPDIAQWSPVDRAQWLDLHLFFIGYGMTCHGDRAGTGFQVETRFPFLDPDVTRFAATLPGAWKLQGFHREKHILRAAYADRLPHRLGERRKFGMRVPGAMALRRGPEDDWVSDLLSDANLMRSEVIDRVAARRLIEAVEGFEGEAPHPYSHAYIHLLSVLLMEKRLVREFRIPDRDIDSILVKQIDGEGAELRVAA